ncbi:hypothetical protein KPH14_003025 [Odynerus spinipes]|uniref:Odorant receptor n=1 Tax=Odynerus spinipes TaxID=1348599 RepID=A0AAD9RWS0_9HYME|nr:hypothetical protein KPH14_003025 [Odynerus spinipes]
MCWSLVFQYRYVVLHLASGDLPDLMDCLSITLSNSLFLIKLIILWMKNRVFNEILKMMMDDWQECVTTQKNLEAVATRVTQSYRYSRYFVIFYIITVILFSSYILLVGERQLVLKAELPFDAKRSPYYELVNTQQFLSQLSAASASSMLNALLLTLLLHVDGQVEIIRRELAEISVIAKKHESCKRMLRSSIARHQKVIAFARNIENIFTYIALVQFLANTIVICSLGFVIVTSLNTDQRYAILSKLIPYYIVVNIEAFVLCFAGEFLSSRSVIIERAAYDTAWYELHPTESRILLLMLIRAQRKLTLTAGKFMDLSLEEFAGMLKASGSYVSVLYAMY